MFSFSLRRQAVKSSNRRILTLNNVPRQTAFLGTTRQYSILNQVAPGQRRLFSPWLAAFLVAGVAASGYGGFMLYQTLTMWPPEIRGDLRNAVRAKYKGDFELSEQHFHRAWNTVQSLPLETLGSQPYLKMTGLAVAFGDVLELSNKTEQAYDVYTQALDLLRQDDVKDTLTGPERLRAVALSSKLGELAAKLNRPKVEEEKWLVWAVEELLRIVKGSSPSSSDSGGGGGSEDVDYHTQGHINLPLLPLPSWMNKTDIGAPLEALGAFYAEAGRLDFAMPLYLNAISLLIPPAPKKSSVEDRCRGAQLMTNLSELIMRGAPTPQTLHQAEAWASQALAVSRKARGEASKSKPVDLCEEVYAAALYNVATFRDMAGDKKTARDLYRDGLEQARSIGMTEGIVEASKALHRIDLEQRQEKEKEQGKS
ncbi:hypothetical protein GYMLUDRAFT_43909 [Collybiopsis luxurians FD-317 M1]|uniref:Uncharacterized protein n=1 Tax=Collybiopsis luxurians FD-317 M1 TaxID=944289 RepID=A0A0D0BWX6_9AGAR|nr:hypothetical protein GYMLUDRAFT_43909 [Collybiopsis luxurians FD-317 M1]